LAVGLGLALANPPVSAEPLPTPVAVTWRVAVDSAAEVQTLIALGFDVLEAAGPGYVLVMGDVATGDALVRAGYEVTVAVDHQSVEVAEGAATYFGGYRTVAEHEQHLYDVQAARPDLARVVDYGDSWGRMTGNTLYSHDLLALCLTRIQPGDCALSPTAPKPRFVLMAAIHARELSTSEVAWRWIDALVAGYGVDPDLTVLMDTNELWVIPVANPDGRQRVEEGGSNPFFQRKNLNNIISTACSTAPTDGNAGHVGVDLNRNSGFQWNMGGSSSALCSPVYMGPSASSEPETYALEGLLRQLFADQRPAGLTDAASQTASGIFISLHSYSDLVLLPWGHTDCLGAPCPVALRAPNDAGLRHIAFRMSASNGYATGQASELLYAASGTNDDWVYGELGVPGFTFEIGSQPGGGDLCAGFQPAYSCIDSLFWPQNGPAFVYAAKVARQPYALSLGPALGPVTVTGAGPITVTVEANDGFLGVGVGRPSAQPVAAVELYVDVPWWAGGLSAAMQASDGAFDEAIDAAQLAMDTTAWSPGRHTLYLRARDADGNWGVFRAVFIDVGGLGPVRVYLPSLGR
jgi:hypothetical protein